MYQRLIALTLLLASTVAFSEAKTAPAATAAAPVESAAPASDYYGPRNPLLGDFTFGPTVTAIGFPTIIRFGLETKYRDIVGLSFEYGFFPTLTFSNVSVGLNAWTIAAKVYPFQKAMYVGLGFGNQSFTGSMTDTSLPTAITVTMNVSTPFLNPHIGWNWIWDSGFFYGMEIGAQIPMSPTTTTSFDRTPANPAETAIANDIQSKTDAKAQTFATQVIPWLTMVRLGWMF